MLVIQLMCVSLLCGHVISSASRRHSLWVLASYISGSTMFPEFSVVLMLDDIQVGYFDSHVDGIRRTAATEVKMDLLQDKVFILRDIWESMKKRLNLVKLRFNLTTGVHVQQRLTGCEVMDGQPVLIMYKDAANGQDADSLMYNMTHFTASRRPDWVIQWDNMKRVFVQTLYSNIYLPVCAQTLKILLDREKRLVTRRVRPRVHFLMKQVVGGAQLTCLATDFYPRHINLTLLRNGQAVDEDQLTGGTVLPNGNGLYQVRKTLMVSVEELRLKHNYTCVASHLSLDNRLQVSWRAEFSRSHRIPIISVPASVALAAGLLVVLLWWRRRRRSKGIAVETQEQQVEPEL
ncbi:hereditary hemochromatosis protein homolog [Sphaeramia orbicularis]|uniref:Hereditary hemochromatosis protein homolog n=1 Tax=Sphaeramia orbicularis TaxID=375764 RepID=A0A672ZWS5_9TELE|nr:hereditary hemochromatosis protein homolog [Sphaeramia orbicularis]